MTFLLSLSLSIGMGLQLDRVQCLIQMIFLVREILCVSNCVIVCVTIAVQWVVQ